MTLSDRYDIFRSILADGGVSRESILVVHSAIATLSRQGYRAEGIIETLLECVGTLVMPAMSWRSVNPEFPFWDELRTPSITGVMSEIFRTKYATHRSIHPTHSAAGRGPAANRLLGSHQFDETPVGRYSPYSLMGGNDAYVLMIGCGLETCTAIHLAEETIAPETYLRPTVEIYTCMDRHGATYSVRTRRHWRLDRDFPQFAKPLEEIGVLRIGAIDGCPYTLVRLASLLSKVSADLVRDPNATIRRIA